MRTIRTAKNRARFLEVMRRTGNITLAARSIKTGRTALYKWRDEESDFAAAWDEAINEFTDLAEFEADRRATVGTRKPVFYKGQQVGSIREYSDTLLMFRLKALRPDLYRETLKQEGISPQVLQLFVQKVLVYVSDTQAQDLLDFLGTQLLAASARGGTAAIPATAGPGSS